jgi:hypothetical protein
VNLQFQVSDEQFRVIWAALAKLPAEQVFPVMENLKAQVAPQEAAYMELAKKRMAAAIAPPPATAAVPPLVEQPSQVVEPSPPAST